MGFGGFIFRIVVTLLSIAGVFVFAYVSKRTEKKIWLIGSGACFVLMGIMLLNFVSYIAANG
ncbi:MAG: hypothetical protein E7315_02740 [Clostridiales bacterium]|nr:hypothetical protein [Clostridiales bacterium]